MAEEIGIQERISQKAKEYVASLDSAKLAELEVEIETAFLAGRQFGEDLLREKTKEWLRNVHTKGDYLSVFLARCDRKNLENSVDNLLGWRTDLKEALSLLKNIDRQITGDCVDGTLVNDLSKEIKAFVEKHEPAGVPPFET